MQKNSTEQPRVALVTGAAKRIGADIAKTLHEAGMNIVLHYRTSHTEALRLYAELNEKREHSAMLLQANLLDIKALNDVARKAVAEWGRLDILINNAAHFYRTQLGHVDEAAWDDLLYANAKSPYFLSQAVAPYLAKQQGCIINIADVHGERPMRDYSVYCISKAALLMMTKSLAKELAPTVRVNAISPTMISPEGENAVSEEIKKKIIDNIALQRLGTGKDIANAVLFLATSANYVTGQVLIIDGGRSLII